MRLKELVAAMEQIAPTRYAETWDNVGLLAGDPDQSVSHALLVIDYTRAVAREGRDLQCDAVIAYHPPIFHPLRRIEPGSVVDDAIRRGVALYSPHTALDVAEGGTNDMLCEIMGLSGASPLKRLELPRMHYKLVTFVPEKDVARVSAALFDAGAGHIGNYSSCSFRSPGTGTFFGESGTSPAVGQSGRLEEAAELRLETIVPLPRVESVLRALRENHPYEVPAFDLVELASPPPAMGQGRMGNFSAPVDRTELISRIKQNLGVEHLLVAGPATGTVTRAACCAGSCGDLLGAARAGGAEFYLTGELRHHDALSAAEAGLTVVCTLHSCSERPALTRVKQRLQQALPQLKCSLSQADADPFRWA